MILYMISFFASMISAAVAFAAGAYFWRKQERGMRIIAVLLGLGLCIDGVALYHIANSQNMSKVWFVFNHAMQFCFVVIALLELGKDVLQTRMFRMLFGSLCLYLVLLCMLLIFAPELLTSKYYAPLSYLWLSWLVSETALHYHRTESLSLITPDLYLMYGFFLYAVGIVVMQSAKIIAPETTPAYLHIMHGVLALIKNLTLLQAFRLQHNGK